MITHSECTTNKSVKAWIVDELAMDGTPLARVAERALAECRLFCMLGQPLTEGIALSPERSLRSIGAAWLPDIVEVRLSLASRFHAIAKAQELLRVSSAIVGATPSDGFMKDEATLVGYGDYVWATTRPSPTVSEIADVIRFSEGYPSGVVAIHAGDPWSPVARQMFAICAFDCETYLWWSNQAELDVVERSR